LTNGPIGKKDSVKGNAPKASKFLKVSPIHTISPIYFLPITARKTTKTITNERDMLRI
jgi:hypothetical protein